MQKRIETVLAVVCMAAAVSIAQTPSGSLRGVVADGQGARIASAAVAVRLCASSLARTIRADDQGNFRMNALKPGAYRVIVTAQGFSDAVADVVIQVSFVLDIAVTMKPPTLHQAVNVHAQSSSITTQAIDLAGQVHQTCAGVA